MINTTPLKTKIKNTSGGSRFFAFLPPHGQTLAADQEFEMAGNPFEAVSSGSRGGTSELKRQAFLNAINARDLTIINTSEPIVTQADDPAPSSIGLVSGSVDVAVVAVASSLINDSGNLSDSDTTFTVDDGSLFAVGDICQVDNELVTVTAISTDDLTVTRATGGTTAASHTDNTPIYVVKRA